MFETVEILIACTMLGTAFLSGIFGMAGGLILIGVLLALMPVPEAMALHAVTQIASNGWRALLWRRHVRWRSAASYLSGAGLAMITWSFWLFVPSKALACFMLGLAPFALKILPERLRPNAGSTASGLGYGGGAMSLMLLTGVSGPLADAFFLGGDLDRREIVATKSVVQVAGHGAKLLYFGGLVAGAGALDPKMAVVAIAMSITGASLARPVLERLTDGGYRAWAGRLLTTIAVFYLGQGAVLFLT